MTSLNPRGFRESELLEEITENERKLMEMVERSVSLHYNRNILMDNLRLGSWSLALLLLRWWPIVPIHSILNALSTLRRRWGSWLLIWKRRWGAWYGQHLGVIKQGNLFDIFYIFIRRAELVRICVLTVYLQIYLGQIGCLPKGIDRTEWKKRLLESGDVTGLIQGDVAIRWVLRLLLVMLNQY